MNDSIVLVVNGVPKGQPRARAFAAKGFVRMYTPGTAEEWKGQIALAAKGKFTQPIEGPIDVSIILNFPRPKSHLRSNGQVRPTAPWRHVAKPDCDNAAKAILDALTTLQAWRDDRQVSSLYVAKYYTEKPGAIITIKPLAEFKVERQGELKCA